VRKGGGGGYGRGRVNLSRIRLRHDQFFIVIDRVLIGSISIREEERRERGRMKKGKEGPAVILRGRGGEIDGGRGKSF